MAFDHDKHMLDPATGFQVDKETGRHVGLHATPIAAPDAGSEFPKWIAAHESHIVRKRAFGAPAHISAPGWEHAHVNRVNGEVTVLVQDEDEEKHASTPSAPAPNAENSASDEDVLKTLWAKPEEEM